MGLVKSPSRPNGLLKRAWSKGLMDVKRLDQKGLMALKGTIGLRA